MATITATDVLTVWPPRKEITLAGLSGAESVTINRIVGGVRTVLRGYDAEFVGTTTRVLYDAEFPFGLPVTYELLLSGDLEDTTSAAAVTLPGGKVALTDAISGLAAEVVIMAHDDLISDAEATVYAIDGQNYVVTDTLPPWTANWEFYTETTTAKNDLDTLLGACTSGILQMRQPGGYDGVDCYASPLSVNTRRFSQDGSDERRRTIVRLAQCAPWPDVLETRGFTLQDVADAYTGQTLTDLAADYATLLLLAQGDFS